MLDIQVATGSSVPIYRQIMDQVRRQVARGTLEVGEQLPSVRSLAESLVLNHNTVARAYNELVRDGVIESRHGRGVYVAEKRQIYSMDERLRRLDHALETLVGEALVLDFTRDELLEALDRKLAESDGKRTRKGGSK